MSPKRIARVAIFAALCIVLRIAFGAFPNIKPITAIFLVSIAYFRLMDSLLIMSLTMLGSSFYFGYSMDIWWQILSFAIIMLVWQFIIFPLTRGKKLGVTLQSLCAFIVVFLYGFCISIPSALLFHSPILIYWLNGLSFDFLHAVSTLCFYPVIYQIFRSAYHEKN